MVPLLLLLALVSSACKMRFDTALTINADESGSFAIEMSFDEEFRQLSEDGGGEGLGDLTTGFEDAPPGWGIEPFTDGEFEGVRIKTDFSSLDDLNGKLDELATADGGSSSPAGNDLFGDLSVTRDGDSFQFRTSPVDFGDDLSGDSGFEGLDPSAFFDQIFEIRLKVTLPGTPGSHNADVVEGNTFIWNIGFDDEGRSFEAASSGGGGGMNVAVIAIAVLVAAGVAFFIISRRNSGGGAGSSSDLLSGVGDPVEPTEGDPFGSNVPENV